MSIKEFLKVAKKHSNASLTEAEFQISNLVNKRPPFARLDMSKPHIMGVINITPDSFYKNSRIDNPNKLNKSFYEMINNCLLYTSPSPRDPKTSRMPSSA